jgi:hypothetical protein
VEIQGKRNIACPLGIRREANLVARVEQIMDNKLIKSGKVLSQVVDLLLGNNFIRPIEKEMIKDPHSYYWYPY